MIEMQYNVREYLHHDRQWQRKHRIDHAKYKLSIATDEKEKQFWKTIISANEDDK